MLNFIPFDATVGSHVFSDLKGVFGLMCMAQGFARKKNTDVIYLNTGSLVETLGPMIFWGLVSR